MAWIFFRFFIYFNILQRDSPMRQLALHLTISLIMLAAVLCGGWFEYQQQPPAPVSFVPRSQTSHAPFDVCFAPGTSEEYMAEWQARIWQSSRLDYELGGRWGRTATNVSTGAPGSSITITYSFVPDGVIVDGSPSLLFSMMNDLFGSEAVWQAKIASIFNSWSRVSGLHYIQVSDDGAAWSNSRGVLGARGDVRIGARSMDGSSGVLAYNYYPDNGDMLLDADENWAAPAQNYIFLRNIVAHEHGHGWGLAHSCPIDQTKLLEPYYSNQFDGPQHDDIRGAQRNYGDPKEPNNSAAAAFRFGTIANDTTISQLGLCDSTDRDNYRFSIAAGKGFTLTLVPVGHSYLAGPQNDDGSCTAGTLINTIDDLDMSLALLRATDSTQLMYKNVNPAGQNEEIYHYEVTAAGDSFIARVRGSGVRDVQLYELRFDIFNLADPFLSISPIVFDTTQIDIPTSRTTQLINHGTSAVTIVSISATAPFSVSPSGQHTIPSGGSLELTVTLQSNQVGQYAGTLNVAHSGPGGQLSCELVGMVASAWLQFVVTNIWDFGEVGLGDTDNLRVPVRAQGNIPLTIQSINVAGPFAMPIMVPLTLNPSQSYILNPTFTPTTLGSFSTEVIIIHTGFSSPDTLFLNGTCVPSSVDDPRHSLPTVYRLRQNYPNPFNPETRITFDLPRAAKISLQVFDVQGRMVKEMADGNFEAGRHTIALDASALPSGIYLYRLSSPEFTDTGKMMLLK